MKTYYQFRFFGETSYQKRYYETKIVKGTITLKAILEQVVTEVHNHEKRKEFKVIYGHIRELTKENGIEINEPAKFDTDKKQAFIIERKDDDISNEEHTFFINDRKIEFRFKDYDVNIINM